MPKNTKGFGRDFSKFEGLRSRHMVGVNGVLTALQSQEKYLVGNVLAVIADMHRD